MIKEKLILMTLTLSVMSCSSMIQSASIIEAYERYEAEEYEDTLELVTRAETINETHPEMKAELTYLKARAYEGLGHQEVAGTLYEYLVDHHRDSQYGYLASKKLAKRM